MVHHHDRRRARHVLDHDGGLAGNVAADVGRERAADEIIGRAGSAADENAHRLAFEERGFVLRLRVEGRQQGADDPERNPPPP
jgi:hypothetical protein